MCKEVIIMRKCVHLIIIVLLLFLVACESSVLDNTDSQNSSGTESTTLDSIKSEAVEYPHFYEYEDIIADYELLVDYRLSEAFEDNWNEGIMPQLSNLMERALDDGLHERSTHGMSLIGKWSNMIVGMTDGLSCPLKGSFGYFFADINRDEMPELFWVREDWTILAVFTIENGQPILLDAFYPKYKCVVANGGELITLSHGGANYLDYAVRVLSESGNLKLVMQFGIDGGSFETGNQYYEMRSEEMMKISQERFDDLLAEYPFELGDKLQTVEIRFL